MVHFTTTTTAIDFRQPKASTESLSISIDRVVSSAHPCLFSTQKQLLVFHLLDDDNDDDVDIYSSIFPPLSLSRWLFGN